MSSGVSKSHFSDLISEKGNNKMRRDMEKGSEGQWKRWGRYRMRKG